MSEKRAQSTVRTTQNTNFQNSSFVLNQSKEKLTTRNSNGNQYNSVLPKRPKFIPKESIKMLRANSQIRGAKKVRNKDSEYSEIHNTLNKSDNAINPIQSNNTLKNIYEANMRIRDSPIKVRHFSLKKTS